MLSADDVPMRIQTIEAIPEFASVTFDDIHDAQVADDGHQAVIQALSDQVQTPHSGI